MVFSKSEKEKGVDPDMANEEWKVILMLSLHKASVHKLQNLWGRKSSSPHRPYFNMFPNKWIFIFGFQGII